MTEKLFKLQNSKNFIFLLVIKMWSFFFIKAVCQEFFSLFILYDYQSLFSKIQAVSLQIVVDKTWIEKHEILNISICSISAVLINMLVFSQCF